MVRRKVGDQDEAFGPLSRPDLIPAVEPDAAAVESQEGNANDNGDGNA